MNKAENASYHFIVHLPHFCVFWRGREVLDQGLALLQETNSYNTGPRNPLVTHGAESVDFALESKTSRRVTDWSQLVANNWRQ